MSTEAKFKEARNSLALSQSLLDKLQQQAPQQPQEMPAMPQNSPETHEEAPMQETPMEEPQEPEMEHKGMLEAIKDTIQPMFDDIKKMFSKEEPQEVEIKIDGEMKPKED